MKISSTNNHYRNWIDRSGAAASFLCAIHCAAMPFLIILFPFLGTGILFSMEFEWGMMILAIVLGVVAALHGYQKHGLKRVAFLFAMGMILLVFARLYQLYEIETFKHSFQSQSAAFLQPYTPPMQSYHMLHAISHKNISFSHLFSVLGGVLMIISHVLNMRHSSSFNRELSQINLKNGVVKNDAFDSVNV